MASKLPQKTLPKLPSGQVVKWQEQTAPPVYANIIGFGMSAFDVYLLFGEIGESNSTEVIAIPKIKVFLSPEQASNTMKLLGIALDNYVERYGPLRTVGMLNPDDIKSQFQAHKAAAKK
jgi:hypothetical protein